MLYAVCHQFISLTFEGDELYTVVGERGEASQFGGWTAVVMERASCFIIEQRCGTKDVRLFESVMKTVVSYLKQNDDVTFLSDCERRYGNTFFTFCAEALRECQRGHPPQVLPESMKVRLKNNLKNNKGAQKSKPGRKYPKYEAPHREHPKTAQNSGLSDIHAMRILVNVNAHSGKREHLRLPKHCPPLFVA